MSWRWAYFWVAFSHAEDMTHIGNVICDLRIQEYFRDTCVLSDEGSRVCIRAKAVFLNFCVEFLDSYIY